MKELNMLVWLTQLGLSVALPLSGWVFLALYLRQRFQLGIWVLICGLIFGFCSAVGAFRHSLKILEETDRKNQKSTHHTVSYNDHE